MSDDAVPQATADHTDDHEALAVGWALHALDHDEEEAFAAHLATCPHCRRTVDETLETFSGIAEATPRPLGTFDVTEQAPSVRSVPSSPEAVPYAGFAVSLEPGRTAPASPTRVVASGQVGR
jgi:anti-sigma factor RsiW